MTARRHVVAALAEAALLDVTVNETSAQYSLAEFVRTGDIVDGEQVHEMFGEVVVFPFVRRRAK